MIKQLKQHVKWRNYIVKCTKILRKQNMACIGKTVSILLKLFIKTGHNDERTDKTTKTREEYI